MLVCLSSTSALFNISELISDIIGMISTIILLGQLLFKVIIYLSKKIHIINLLQFSNNKCCISLSVFKKENVDSRYDYVTLSSMQSYQKLEKLMDIVNIDVLPYSELHNGNNIIHIGGPVTNINVNSLFSTKYNNIKYYTSEENRARYERYGTNHSCIEYTTDGEIYYEIGSQTLKIDKDTQDYGIFIRIPACPKNGIEYTTHIIFGTWSEGTQKAVDFFIANYKMISKKYKKNKYCFAVPISRINGAFEQVGKTDIIDLTDDFFCTVNTNDNNL